MKQKSPSTVLVISYLFMIFLGFNSAKSALAQSPSEEIKLLKERLNELEAKLETQQEQTSTLAEEVSDNQLDRLLPEKAELKSEWGFGPAASGVYQVKGGLSIGGYAEISYRNFVDDDSGKKDFTDAHRVITYIGYKLNDWILFNSEIEYEHATTSSIGGVDGDESGSVSVEFAYLDFFLDPAINVRAGTLLVPMGLLNEIHEPATYHGVLRPEVETRLIPTTWRENGFGLFGNIGSELEYRTYIMGGLRASRFGDQGIRGGRQKGSRALAEGLAWVSRVDYTPQFAPGLLLGGSF